MKTEAAVSELGEDAETGVRLLAGGMSPADYFITGWVIVTAYDPDRYGLSDAAGESPSAQANIACVTERRGKVRRLFRRRKFTFVSPTNFTLQCDIRALIF